MMIRNAAGVVAILLTAGLAFGQPEDASLKRTPKAKKSALELALEEALQHNPDLNVSTAKLAEAEAELSRTRAQVVQKVVAAYQAIEKAREQVADRSRRAEAIRLAGESSKGSVSKDEIGASQASLAAAKAVLASAESEMEYLTGKTKTRTVRYRSALDAVHLSLSRFDYHPSLSRSLEAVKGPSADRLRKALEKKAAFTLNETAASDALDLIRKNLGDVHIQVADRKHAGWSEKMTAKLTDATVAAMLQLIEDATGQRVVVREYGLLIVPQEKTPPGAVPLTTFFQKKDEPAK